MVDLFGYSHRAPPFLHNAAGSFRRPQRLSEPSSVPFLRPKCKSTNTAMAPQEAPWRFLCLNFPGTASKRSLERGESEGDRIVHVPAAADLVRWMLSVEPKDRPTASEVLNHVYCKPVEQKAAIRMRKIIAK